MSRDYYHEDDINDYELVEDQIEQPDLIEEAMDDLEIPDVRWKEDLAKIPDYDLKLEEIEKAKKFLNEEKVLREKVDSGDMSVGMYESITRPKIIKATTRAGLASVRFRYDDLGDASEDYDFLTTGDLKMTELKDRIKDTIEKMGPDAAEELADRMHDEERLGDDAHDLIKRQVRIRRGEKG